MKVVFNGMMETISEGCSACGQRRKSRRSFQASRSLIMPSNRTMVFHRGVPVEVSKSDGEWLLSWTEKDPSGMTRQVFTEVE